MWYLVIGVIFYICLCIGLQILYLTDNRVDKPDVIMGSILGILLSIAWPLSMTVVGIYFLTRYLAKLILKNFKT